jgi:DnaJ family protein C protein 28
MYTCSLPNMMCIRSSVPAPVLRLVYNEYEPPTDNPGREVIMDPIEKILEEARKRGDFDNLPGAGKPQDLSENPYVPADWRMAYRMLAGNGFAPEVVESDKALRQASTALAASLDTFAARWQRLSGPERQSRLEERATFLRAYEADVRALNSRIHGFNYTAPRAMQRGTLLVEKALAEAAARLPV